MPGCCCDFGSSAEQHFTRERAAKELEQYRRKGIGITTRLLRDGLARAGLVNGRLLDIGAGFGALTFELLDRGAAHAVIVEASPAYLETTSDEAIRRRRTDQIELVQGDFLDVAERVPSANTVTLDRVVCCYPFYQRLLAEALRHAERGFAFSYPRDRWFVRLGMTYENVLRRWRGNPFRTFVHPPAHMQRLIEAAGFRLVSRERTPMWSADVYMRIRITDSLI
jgi:magnesium-protoporphyrin O-methyltransferase